MTTTTLTARQWKMVHRLAAELAQRDMDVNMVQTAAAYMKDQPQADLEDWLYRLVQLGELFGSSNQTHKYRHELWAACQRLEPAPQSGREWGLVLAWAARLQKVYEMDRARARKISDVSHIQLPPAPAVYRPPVQETTFQEPKPPKKASAAAEDLFAQMQAKWARHEEDEK